MALELCKPPSVVGMWLGFVLLFITLFTIVHAVEGFVRLVPGVSRDGEAIAPGDSVVYMVEQLNAKLLNKDPAASYEVRLSYPATTPSEFLLELEQSSPLLGDLPIASQATARRLFNTDKLMLAPSDMRLKGVDGVCIVRATAKYAGVSTDPDMDKRPIYYNILVQPVVFGIPTDAFPVISLCIAATLLAVFFVAPRYAQWLHTIAKEPRRGE